MFYKDFNLRFKVPNKDTRKKCDHYFVKAKTATAIDRQMNEEWHKTNLDNLHGSKETKNDDLEREED